MDKTKWVVLRERKFILKISITDRNILKSDFDSLLVAFLNRISYILFSWVISQKLRLKVNFLENAILKKWARLRSVTLNIFVQQVDRKKVFFHHSYIRHYWWFFKKKTKKNQTVRKLFEFYYVTRARISAKQAHM